MSIIGSNILAGASGQAGYNINNSLRFRSSASAFLNRTPGTTGNQKTFTWSGWVKRGALGSQQFIHHAFYGDSGRYASIYFTSSDTLQVQSGIYTTGASTSTSYNYITTQVFRDPSAWYHIVLAVDTTQATSGNRVKLYVNGSQITAFGTSTAPTQNDNTFFNITTTPMYIGKYAEAPGSSFLDGYLADINWVDGSQLTPSSFGETSLTTGSWIPKKYTSTYGTNGFYLKFADASAATAAAIGKDSSGNGNNWTPSGISVTAGITYDAMLDVPTNTSATVANYAVLNKIYTNTQGVATLTDANLKFSFTIYSTEAMVGTFGASTGKWYWEFIASANPVLAGIRQVNTTDRFSNSILWGGSSISGTGDKWVNGTSSAYAGASWTTGDVIGVAVDMDGGTVTFYKNNTSQGSIALSLATITDFVPAFNNGASTAFAGDINFGQRPFSYTPPSGFVRLNTYNLPDSTIKKGNTVMDATLYTGNGTSQSITNSGGFQPDLVWNKSRSFGTSPVNGHNTLYDVLRGATKELYSDLTSAEATNSQSVTSFNSNGFSVGSEQRNNNNGSSYVGWQWKANGTGVSNTNGTITSTVSVNTTAGFSIVTANSGTAGNKTVGHGLGVAPKLVIMKVRTATGGWYVWTTGFSASQFLILNATDAVGTDSRLWANATPTSSVVSFESGYYPATSQDLVFYCWAEIAGFSKFGSYTGNGSADGPFIFCNFRPKWLLIKQTDVSRNWILVDSSRNTFNIVNLPLIPNDAGAEYTSTTTVFDFLSNGFKIRSNHVEANGSGNTYIVAAFAESPFKNSNAR